MSQENEITREVTLRAPLNRVWAAIADPQQFGEWFGCIIDGPFRVGEVVNCRGTYEGGEGKVWQKLIKAIEPERYFAYAWSPGNTGADLFAPDGEQTLVEFTLEAVAEDTILVIRESGFDSLSEASRARSYRINTDGWNAQVENITNHVQR